MLKAWRYDPRAPENRAYCTISAAMRLTYTLYYLGLVVFLALLAVMTHDLHGMPGSLRAGGMAS